MRRTLPAYSQLRRCAKRPENFELVLFLFLKSSARFNRYFCNEILYFSKIVKLTPVISDEEFRRIYRGEFYYFLQGFTNDRKRLVVKILQGKFYSIFIFKIVKSIIKYVYLEAFKAFLTIDAGKARQGHLISSFFILVKLKIWSISLRGCRSEKRGSRILASHVIETFLIFLTRERLKNTQKISSEGGFSKKCSVLLSSKVEISLLQDENLFSG